jgi:hypothetical protein
MIVALLGALPAHAWAQAHEPVLPGWMAGCWEQSDGDRWTEECWMPPRGGLMLGAGRTGKADQVTEWETTQIVLGDRAASDHAVVRMAFWAAPNGTGRTAFAWSPDGKLGVTFHNVANDYPQRIRYWRDGEKLMAEISMEDGSRAMRWSYTRTSR